VSTAIVGTAIAAPLVAPPPRSGDGAVPTADISRVGKDGWIIATGKGSIVGGSREPA
jgi:hypothetical protein